MKIWHVSALLAAMICYLLVGCRSDNDRTRAERARGYFRQYWDFGKGLEYYPVTTSTELAWYRRASSSQAGVIAGALGLEWPPPLENDAMGRESRINAYCSWNWRYCLLALSMISRFSEKDWTRFCLIDTTGRVGWTRDLFSFQEPVISDSGTVALFTLTRYPVEKQMRELGLEIASHGSKEGADTSYRREYNAASLLASKRDSFIVAFINAKGKVLGHWTCPRSGLIMPENPEGGYRYGVFAFMPHSEKLFMLVNPRRKTSSLPDTTAQYVRCLRTDGSVEWQYDLGDSPATTLAFAGNGGVIAFGKRRIDQLSQSDPPIFDNEIFVFDANGHLIGHIERRCSVELDNSWLVTYKPNYLYFIADKVEVLDLKSGKLLTQVPLRPLYDELSKGKRWRSTHAERLIRKQLELSMRDSIPPLE